MGEIAQQLAAVERERVRLLVTIDQRPKGDSVAAGQPQ